MPSLPSDPGATAFARVADELAALRHGLEALTQRLAELATENTALRDRLDRSEAARTDLAAQTEHIIEVLAQSRSEVKALQRKSDRPAHDS